METFDMSDLIELEKEELICICNSLSIAFKENMTKDELIKKINSPNEEKNDTIKVTNLTNLTNLTKKELLDICDNIGITKCKSKTKNVIIDMINEKYKNLEINYSVKQSPKNIVKTNPSLGQYFTTNTILKEKVFEFILNNPSNILEPSMGRGDLIQFITDRIPSITFDMYEIDETIKLLDTIQKDNVIYGDFLNQEITKKYKTIIGNPPYVKTKNGNLYINFTEKCYNLLVPDGELIFIVPSDFLKLTSASNLLNRMMEDGTFTHIFHPHNEKLFDNASIDVILFRYYKNNAIEKTVLYNDKLLYITNSNGLITFEEEENNDIFMFNDYFDIYVGLVSGKEEVYKNEDLGNIDLLNGENKVNKYIYIEQFPCENEQINKYLSSHKKELIERKIKKFNENNWFEWGAPRNITTINENIGEDCIYIYNLTRKVNVSFVGKVTYFGGGLIMLKPKKKCNLNNIVSYINSNKFKDNFMFSGRFKIGHRQISNSYIPSNYL